MLTIERFYFSAADASGKITAGSDGTDYSLEFHGGEGEGPALRLTVRGRDEFRRVLGTIASLGETLVSPPTIAAPAPPAPEAP